MEGLDINLLRTPARSVARRVTGILTIIIAVIWLITIFFLKEKERTVNILFSVYFIIYGATFVISGSGISISKWFGEAYIRIDPERISIKKGVFSKEWSLRWSEVEHIDFSVIRILFTLRDSTTKELNYDLLEWEHIRAIKGAIRDIAAEKGIMARIPG